MIRVAGGLGLVAVLLVGAHYIERAVRCKSEGLTQVDAQAIADWKLGQQFRDPNAAARFERGESQFYEDKVWTFGYRSGSCEIDVAVDACGVTDVAGLSEGCLAMLDERKSN